MSEDTTNLRVLPITPEVVRRLDAKDGPDPPIRSQPGFNDCRHRHVSLDMAARCLRCDDCEKVIDPIVWLEHLAHEWDSYSYRWRDARRRIRAIEARLLDLERQERNAKSRIRNAKKRAGLEQRDDGWPLCPRCGGDTLEDRGNPVPNPGGALWCRVCMAVTARNGRAA